jgi:hypothetical protein
LNLCLAHRCGQLTNLLLNKAHVGYQGLSVEFAANKGAVHADCFSYSLNHEQRLEDKFTGGLQFERQISKRGVSFCPLFRILKHSLILPALPRLSDLLVHLRLQVHHLRLSCLNLLLQVGSGLEQAELLFLLLNEFARYFHRSHWNLNSILHFL